MKDQLDEEYDGEGSTPQAGGALSRVRAILGWSGVAGSLLVVGSVVMQGWAQAHGVHCPDCDRPADMAFWTTYFDIKLILLGLGALGGLLALVAARGALRRFSGVLAMVLAFVVLGMTPK